MNIELAPLSEIDRIWPIIREGVVKSCEKTGNSIRPGWIWQQCRSGLAHLLVVHDGTRICGAVVLQFEDYGATLKGLAMTGDDIGQWWPQMVEEVKRMAIENGVERFVDDGRVGLKKIYPDARIVSTRYEIRS